MTDLDGGLPVAAIVDDPNSAEYEHCLKIPVASKEMSKDVIEWGDELVRRKDVKQLIQDKYVDPLKKEIERIKGGVHELENPELVIEHHENQLKNFEELLEELEQ